MTEQVLAYICNIHDHELTFGHSFCMALQINSEGVKRNFYPGDTLPLWHEELEPQNSLLDMLAAGEGPAPMTE